MPNLELSLSESLLLGFCTQEYRQSGESLFEVFEQRLRPFVPRMTQTKFRPIRFAELPDDAEWYTLIEESSLPKPSKATNSKIKDRSTGVYSPPPKYHFVETGPPSFDDGKFSIGRARSCPKVAFISNQREVPLQFVGCPNPPISKDALIEVFWDRSRRSLIEQIIDRIERENTSPHADLISRWAVPSESRWLWDFATFLDEAWDVPSPPSSFTHVENEIPWWVVHDGADPVVYGLSQRLDHLLPASWKPKAVVPIIESCVSDDLKTTFETGCRFAQLVHACEAFDAYLEELQSLATYLDPRADEGSPEYDEDRLHGCADGADEAHCQILQCLRGILNHQWTPRCAHAESILEAEFFKRSQRGSPGGFVLAPLYWDERYLDAIPYYADDDWETYFDQRYGYLSGWSGAGAAAWLAFGDVLGTFRETDRLTAGKDRPLPSLRAYQLCGDSSVDKIRAALQLSEQELANESDANHHPENVIAAVANGIEGLARRVWPDDIPKGDARKGKLVGVLHDKRRDESNQLERRFANLALTLYNEYRKPAHHDLDSFQCTWAEARFFVSGMRVLFDISERLVGESGK